LYVFQVMRLRNKAAVTSILVLILLVAGGGIYVRASSENAMPHNLKTIPESAVQTISAESMIMRNPSESTETSFAVMTQESAAVESTSAATIEIETQQESSVKCCQGTELAAAVPTANCEKTQNDTEISAKQETKQAEVSETTSVLAEPIMGNLSGSYNCDMAYAILDLVNQQRTEAGLSGLFWDATLAASAKIRAAEVPVKWSHTRPDGSAWYTAGSQTQNGENLAAGELTAQQTVTDWMNSPNHAENVLRSCFNSMGVACYFCNGVYYWVILFS